MRLLSNPTRHLHPGSIIIPTLERLTNSQSIQRLRHLGSREKINIRHQHVWELILDWLNPESEPVQPAPSNGHVIDICAWLDVQSTTTDGKLSPPGTNELSSLAHRFPRRSCSSSSDSNSALKFPLPKL